jgi:GAF domain-containing protein
VDDDRSRAPAEAVVRADEHGQAARIDERRAGQVDDQAFVGITLMVEGKPRTAVFTDETAPQIDHSQYDTGDGPCLDAFREQQVFSIACTEDQGPWPTFRAAAAGHGIHSTLSLPLVVDKASVGAMNLYADRADAFGPDDHETAATFASHARSSSPTPRPTGTRAASASA